MGGGGLGVGGVSRGCSLFTFGHQQPKMMLKMPTTKSGLPSATSGLRSPRPRLASDLPLATALSAPRPLGRHY